MKILESKRLLLRRFRPADIRPLHSLYCDPEVLRFIPDAPRSLQETKKELEWFLNGHPKDPRLGLWATIEKESNQFIGRCGLLPWSIEGVDEIEVAYLIAKQHRGRGFGTEAAQAILQYGVNQLEFSRLVCLIDQDNLASIKVAEKIGMTFEKESADEIGPFLLYATQKQNPSA